ncbi:glycoside hydrolase family 15 protein [Actinoplanes sp. KI2]|uniref:glycoside hydrolase family 15 protein n=1 Tax=Actinoplanes sp. KI2 TaxID=2983315 RepID=UPI0021D5D7CB|nr:glycoside hydrolase family 15 protein [Actinoplanes sp. KI2]MCU7726264.1 glycoside hydrolase family 15 protein [Actinoplanes sp. KI2]
MAEQRRDGYVPIGDYAVLGDGRTVALAAADGRIDWLPLPALHAPPVFAALLDPAEGGYLELRPRQPFTVTRRYRGNAPILESTYTTTDGSVRVVEALTGPQSWGELVRRADGLAGHVPMTWTVRPGTRFGTAQPWTEGLVVHCGDQHLAIRCFDAGDPVVTAQAVTGEFTTAPGSSAIVALACGDDGPVPLPGRGDLIGRLDAVQGRWRSWESALTYDGRWRDAVWRSALMLKLLQFGPTGAVAAAATTSLPERIGGDQNWDYRYMWVRDAAFTVDALLGLRLEAEAHAALSFLLRCISSTGPELKVFYRLDGGLDDSEQRLTAPGYRGSRPVRSGNSAAGQTQLGTYGHLLDAVGRYLDAGHVLDPRTGRLLADVADRCCDDWKGADSGIWELPDDRHYTQSKMGCWAALDRAVRLHEQGRIPSNHADRWRRERDLIHDWVDEHCWSPAKNAYTFYAGTDDLDAATLLAAQTGFDRGARLAGTVDAIRRELADGPLIHRYTGSRGREGAFLACSFWLASALAALGRRDEAAGQMDATVALANDLGILSEEISVKDHGALGNVPQALSHLALISAALQIDPAAAGQ